MLEGKWHSDYLLQGPFWHRNFTFFTFLSLTLVSLSLSLFSLSFTPPQCFILSLLLSLFLSSLKKFLFRFMSPYGDLFFVRSLYLSLSRTLTHTFVSRLILCSIQGHQTKNPPLGSNAEFPDKNKSLPGIKELVFYEENYSIHFWDSQYSCISLLIGNKCF